LGPEISVLASGSPAHFYILVWNSLRTDIMLPTGVNNLPGFFVNPPKHC